MDSHQVLSQIFEILGPHLRTLIICNSTLDDFTFLTILRCSSFLAELFLSEVVIEKKLPAINPTSIVHLTSVAIHHTNWEIFKFLQRSQITSLLINNYVNEGEGTRVHLLRMLSNQYRLSELVLYGTSSKTLFKDSDFNDNWNYHLSKFHIGCGFGKNSDTVDGNIINFLIVNSETLRNVEIVIPNCELITEFILLNLNNVTSMTLDVGSLPKGQLFYQTLQNMEPNLQLVHLKLSGFFSEYTFVNRILKLYPALTDLELDDWSNTTSKSNTLKFVSKQCPKLKQLFVPEISSNGDTLTFNALKQLHVTYIRDSQKLITFIQKNKSIEVVKIGLVYNEQLSAISKLIYLTEVHNFSFAGSVTILQTILDLIQKDTPETLKTLELTIASNLKNAGLSSMSSTLRKSIKINFPINSYDLRTELNALL